MRKQEPTNTDCWNNSNINKITVATTATNITTRKTVTVSKTVKTLTTPPIATTTTLRANKIGVKMLTARRNDDDRVKKNSKTFSLKKTFQQK